MPRPGIPLDRDKIETHMRHAGIRSQRQLAEAIHVSLKTVSNYMRGRPAVLEHVAALAELFDVPAAELIAEGHVPAEPITTVPERLGTIEQLLHDLPNQVDVGFEEFREHVAAMTRKLDLLLDNFGLSDALDRPHEGLTPHDEGREGQAGEDGATSGSTLRVVRRTG